MLTSVNDLIDPHTGSWDEELIRTIFNPVDIRRILQIPLSNQGFDDFIAWHVDRRGIFTVYSAYHLQ